MFLEPARLCVADRLLSSGRSESGCLRNRLSVAPALWGFPVAGLAWCLGPVSPPSTGVSCYTLLYRPQHRAKCLFYKAKKALFAGPWHRGRTSWLKNDQPPRVRPRPIRLVLVCLDLNPCANRAGITPEKSQGFLVLLYRGNLSGSVCAVVVGKGAAHGVVGVRVESTRSEMPTDCERQPLRRRDLVSGGSALYGSQATSIDQSFTGARQPSLHGVVLEPYMIELCAQSLHLGPRIDQGLQVHGVTSRVVSSARRSTSYAP
jgi:hypothetical protein